MRTFVFLLLFALVTAVVGCGGGGGGASVSLPPGINGMVKLHSSTERPRIVLVRWLDDGTTGEMASVSLEVPPNVSGWLDIPFALLPPNGLTASEFFTLELTNDQNQNGRYESGEFRGTADGYPFWNENEKRWQIYDLEGNVKWQDAFAQGGKENIYIEAQFSRSVGRKGPNFKKGGD